MTETGIEKITKDALLLVSGATTLKELDEIRICFLGKNGIYKQLLKALYN